MSNQTKTTKLGEEFREHLGLYTYQMYFGGTVTNPVYERLRESLGDTGIDRLAASLCNGSHGSHEAYFSRFGQLMMQATSNDTEPLTSLLASQLPQPGARELTGALSAAMAEFMERTTGYFRADATSAPKSADRMQELTRTGKEHKAANPYEQVYFC